LDAERQKELFRQVAAEFINGNGFNPELLNSLESSFNTIWSMIFVKFNEAARQKEKDFCLTEPEIGTFKNLCHEILQRQRDQRQGLNS